MARFLIVTYAMELAQWAKAGLGMKVVSALVQRLRGSLMLGSKAA